MTACLRCGNQIEGDTDGGICEACRQPPLCADVSEHGDIRLGMVPTPVGFRIEGGKP